MLIEEANRFEAESLAELSRVADAAALEQWRSRVLGGSGALKSYLGQLKDVPKAEKPAAGQHLNAVKSRLEAAFESRKGEVGDAPTAGPMLDITEPGIPPPDGRQHVLTRTIDEIVEVFGRMGFSLAEGPEVEDEWHNFTALNIPEGHPARDPTDNFYMGEGHTGDGSSGAKRLLRTQTSTVQIRALEKQKPPLRIIATGRVYRPDTHDATHYSMFHQIEGLFVDHGVTMVDLKSTLVHFAHAYFGAEAEVRMRPSFFPFTEPSAEVDMKMRVKGEWKWVELGGCGMVDPNVLRAVKLDPEEWTGFAFGLGIERIAMRRYGIADIRWLFENDARFLRQF